DVVDFEDGRLGLRATHKAAGASAALDQAGLGKLRQRLVHCHARAIVFGAQFVFERNAVAGRPCAGQDLIADIGQDALVQRGSIAFRPCRFDRRHLVPAPVQPVESSCITARKRRATASRRLWRPPSTSFLPCTHTQSTAVPFAKIQASRIASPVFPASEGCVASSDTKSVAAPAVNCEGPAPSAAPPPANAAENSARPFDCPGAASTLRARWARRCEYS